MADLVAYQQWLTQRKRHTQFLDNYWCAALAHEMEESKLEATFKIPYFIAEEELKREDNNVNQRDAYISNGLRHWLIHLLKAFNNETSIHNYEEVLRDFIFREAIPFGISLPLTASTSFHNLPTECKLWILYELSIHKKPLSEPREISRDPLGNAYYIVSDARLYVRLARGHQTALPIDDERLEKEPWGSLYRFVLSQPCILLCENQQEWDFMWNAFLSFKLSQFFYTIRPEMALRLHQVGMIRDEERREFEELLIKLNPVPKARMKTSLESAARMNNVPKTNIKGTVAKEPVSPTTVSTEQRPNKRSNQIMGKCWNFPQCPLQNRCKYVHPRNPCTKFPNCPRGWECLFLHEFCPNDADCEEPNCAYEHTKSITTYYRMSREEPETLNPRPIALVPPTIRKSNSELDKIESETTTPLGAAQSGAARPKQKRCQMFPQCKKEKDGSCPHFHPTHICRNVFEGRKCPGQWCLFMHGPCPVDEECDDLKCIYEHHKNTPVVVRKYAAKKFVNQPFIRPVQVEEEVCTDHGAPERPAVSCIEEPLQRASSISNLSMPDNNGSLSRTTSMSNLRISGRRKSVSFADDDGESIVTTPIRKESNNQKPVGILGAPSNANNGRCLFGPRCTKKACDFVHPTKKCPVFPKCPKGGACIFLHDKCEKDGVCVKENCDFEHYLPHEIDNKWCKKGSLCMIVGCKFIHPKGCTGGCPVRSECWMYHRPGPTRSSVPPPAPPRPAPLFPPGPGYGPVPLFGGPPPPGYGYGPGYGHAPTNYPPGPGYGPQFGHYNYAVPVGRPLGHGYPQGGYGPGHGYPSGPFGPRPGPTTPGPSPAPPFRNQELRQDGRDAMNGKAEQEFTRF